MWPRLVISAESYHSIMLLFVVFLVMPCVGTRWIEVIQIQETLTLPLEQYSRRQLSDAKVVHTDINLKIRIGSWMSYHCEIMFSGVV